MKLSIITINKNNAEGLEKTCQSVDWQTFSDFEWIVIDGASTDNSVDVIKKYANKITHWVSEPDTGTYNAMNKGIRLSKGEYCLFLNSGDWLLNPNSLKNGFDIINTMESADIYYSDCLNSDFTIWKMPKPLTIDSFYMQIVPNHQNTLIKRSLFYDHEFYDEKYKTVSDSIFFVKEFWMHHVKFSYVRTIFAVYQQNGMSHTYKFAHQELHDEMKRIMGDTEFKKMIKRVGLRSKRFFLARIIKYLLPYGLVRFIQKYIVNKVEYNW